MCVFALGKSVREKSAANEFKAFCEENKKNRVLFKYLVRIYTHCNMFISIYNIFFARPHEASSSSTALNVRRFSYLYNFFSFIMNRMKMKMNVCTIIYNYKVKSEEERQRKKMQEASFNNLNKQRVKHTFFIREKMCTKNILYSSVEIYMKKDQV